jgi:RNA polymerase sigma-70 factor (ECF subfamily)
MEEHTGTRALVDQLYRDESGKLVSVLARIFGPDNLDLAEDVVQEAFAGALVTWEAQGIPGNPPAWLFTVAKNKALTILNREKLHRQYAPDVAHLLQSEWTAEPALDHLFSEEQILDDQLRMLFTCCHPAISSDSQVALALKTLCGFSIPEIARAFLTTEENINKRLVRARRKIRKDKIPFEVPEGEALTRRLDAVLETMYFMFNEGYSASQGEEVIRHELCEEAIRCTELIGLHPGIGDKSTAYALLALMEFNASRFKARVDSGGGLLTMAEQDRSLWDRTLIQKGMASMAKSSSSTSVSKYHILAAISAHHCSVPDVESTDWKSILSLYDALMRMDNSPVIALNRAVALSKVEGAGKALGELERIRDHPSLQSYHIFYAVQAEFCIELRQFANAADALETSIRLASSKAEKALLRRKLKACRENIVS